MNKPESVVFPTMKTIIFFFTNSFYSSKLSNSAAVTAKKNKIGNYK